VFEARVRRADVWSENPIEPPETVDADQDVLRSASGETWTHAELLSVAAGVAADHEMDGETTVSLTAPLTEPGALVAGILAPMAVGATIVVPELAEDGSGYQDSSREDVDSEVSVDGSDGSIDAGTVTDSLREIRRA